jgi:cobalamin biosynthesis protein CobT
MLLDSYDVSKYIAACAHKVGMPVIWEKAGGSPRTDGTTMWIPEYDAFDKDAAVKLMQFVKHATSHIAHSDFNILKEHKPKGLLMFLMSLIEDHRVDWLNDQEFVGDKINTDAYYVQWCKGLSKMGIDHPDKQQAVTLFAWDLGIRMDLWNTLDVHTKMKKHADKDVLRNLEKYSDEVRGVRCIIPKEVGAAEGYALACKILKEVYGVDPSECEDSADGEGKSPKDGESEGGGESDEDGVGECDATATAEDGAGAGEGADEGKGVAKSDKTQFIDFKGAELSPYTEHKATGSVHAINYEVGKGVYTPTAPEKVFEHDFTTGISKNFRMPTAPGDATSIAFAVEKCVSLSNVLRTKLQIYSKDRTVYGQKKGALHSASLWRATMKDAKGHNEKVFKSKVHNDTLNVCIQLVIDASGSMSGSKYVNASAAAVALNNTLSSVLHIPVEILAFTEMSSAGKGRENTMFVLKNFSKNVSTGDLIKSFARVGECLCDNVDGESLVYAYNRIVRRKEKRRIMIVLSDGSPAGGYTKGDISVYTKHVIKAIEASPIEIMGVGLEHEGVSHWYKHSDVIPSATQIEASLIRIIDKQLFKGK